MHKNTTPKPLIYFAHANGFPALCYKKLFTLLEPHFDLDFLDTIGHSKDYPVTDNWDYLVKELIVHIEKIGQKVIGVGHSLGGVLHFLASQQRPDLYRQVIMLDAPVLNSSKSMAIRVMKFLGMIDKITPAGRTKNRKQYWHTPEEAMAYLQTKPLFASFDPDCLRDYVHYGMVHGPNGIHLRFNREIEYQIYRTLPHNLSDYRHRRKVPTALLYGNATNVIHPVDLSYMQKQMHIITHVTPGSHLFPFEHPQQAAKDLELVYHELERGMVS